MEQLLNQCAANVQVLGSNLTHTCILGIFFKEDVPCMTNTDAKSNKLIIHTISKKSLSIYYLSEPKTLPIIIN